MGCRRPRGKMGPPPEPPALEAAGRGELCRGIPGAWRSAPASLRTVCPASGLARVLRGSAALVRSPKLSSIRWDYVQTPHRVAA